MELVLGIIAFIVVYKLIDKACNPKMPPLSTDEIDMLTKEMSGRSKKEANEILTQYKHIKRRKDGYE